MSAQRLLRADKEGRAPPELAGVRPGVEELCHWLPGLLSAAANRALTAVFLAPPITAQAQALASSEDPGPLPCPGARAGRQTLRAQGSARQG